MQRRSLLSWLNEFVGVLAGVAVCLVVVVTFYEVILRYVLNRPTGWSVQFSGYFLLAAAFFSFSYALHKDNHVRVELVLEHLPGRIRSILLLVGYVIGLAFCAVLTWQTGLMAIRAYKENWFSPDLIQVPLGPVYSVMPLGGCVLCATFIGIICRYVKELFH